MNTVTTSQRNYCAARAVYETISAECRRHVDARFGAGYLPGTDEETETYVEFEIDTERELGRLDALALMQAAEIALFNTCRAHVELSGAPAQAVNVLANPPRILHLRRKLVEICMSLRI